MDCAHPVPVVDLDAEEAIAYSYNSYFAEAANATRGEVLRFDGWLVNRNLVNDNGTLPRGFL